MFPEEGSIPSIIPIPFRFDSFIRNPRETRIVTLKVVVVIVGKPSGIWRTISS
jgi:hypothetical protein